MFLDSWSLVCDDSVMAKKGRRATNDERLRAVQLLEHGYSADEVADILQVGRSSVFAWQAMYRAGGLAALSTKFASGRPTTLSDEQMVRLYSLIVGADPRQYSFGVALWTRKLVGDLIFLKFQVRLSLPTVGRILTTLGMSPQRPLYRAYQQDPERVRVWKQQTYPQIKAAAARVGATIFFADEAGVRTDHHAGTTWAPVGRTPVVAATGERKSVNMVSAVSPGGQIHFDVFEGSMNATRFVEFCAKLVHDCPTPVFLIVDGSSAHTAKIVKKYVASTGGQLSLFFLPPYSPELNPDEWVWKNVKHDTVGRTVAMSKGHLYSIVYDALRRLQTTPQIIKGFFADPCLTYIAGEP
jgi:transposase